LDVEKGEMISIMGASGSGKSTLLNILGILDNYDVGDYILDGMKIKKLSERKAAQLRNKKLGFVFQSFNLVSFKNAMEMWLFHFITRMFPGKAKCHRHGVPGENGD